MQSPRNDTSFSHRHGGYPEYDFKRLGIQPRSIIDFSVNVNPLGPPQEVIDCWSALGKEISSYPSIDGAGVRHFYQERFDLSPDSILPGNGSVEMIYLVPRALNIKHVAILSPSFHDYTRAALLSDAIVSPLPLSAETEFMTWPIEELEKRIFEVDAVFIGNPNNPTGTITPREVLYKLTERYADTWFLIDEAFVQFLDHHEQITLMGRRYLRPNLLVCHSMTKFYALAGLRLGAVIGHPRTIARLQAFKEPWTINVVAEKLASVLLRCLEYEERTRELISSERQRLYSLLRTIPGIRVFNPTANFFLAQWTSTENLDDLLLALLPRGLYVRDCRNFEGLEQNYFRFAIRTPPENDHLCDALVDITKVKHG